MGCAPNSMNQGGGGLGTPSLIYSNATYNGGNVTCDFSSVQTGDLLVMFHSRGNSAGDFSWQSSSFSDFSSEILITGVNGHPSLSWARFRQEMVWKIAEVSDEGRTTISFNTLSNGCFQVWRRASGVFSQILASRSTTANNTAPATVSGLETNDLHLIGHSKGDSSSSFSAGNTWTNGATNISSGFSPAQDLAGGWAYRVIPEDGDSLDHANTTFTGFNGRGYAVFR